MSEPRKVSDRTRYMKEYKRVPKLVPLFEMKNGLNA
jgi:hypothetical protein